LSGNRRTKRVRRSSRKKIDVLWPQSTLIYALFPVQQSVKRPARLQNVKRNPEGALVRKAYMLQLQELLTDIPDDAEPSKIICKDCKSTVSIKSLIPVDDLHRQCPQCLYIFFFKETPTSER